MGFHEDNYSGDEICELLDEGEILECDIHYRLVWAEDASICPYLDGTGREILICRWCEGAGARRLIEQALEAGVTYPGVLAWIEQLYVDEGNEEMGKRLGQALLERFSAACGH